MLQGKGYPAVATATGWDVTVPDTYPINATPGAQGPAGPEGPAGPQGPIGPMGPTGIGLQGPAGAQGIQGPAGAAGATGAAGKTIESAAFSGDDIVFTLNDESTVTLPDAVTALTGPQGIQGEQGIQGIQGIQGNTGATGTQGIQGETGPQGPAGDETPIGSGMEWYTATPPAGWLLQNGAAVSRTTYAALFSIIGTIFGVGDGSTTFNLPARAGYISIGVDSGDSNYDAAGKKWGEKSHTLTSAESGVPAHTHAVNNVRLNAAAPKYFAAGTDFQQEEDTATDANAAANASSAHNNMQPGMAVYWIIKY